MMTLNTPIKENGGFVCAMLALSLIGVAAFRNTISALERERGVSHTREVLETTNRVLAELLGAETERRGYVLTGKRQFLSAHRRDRALLEKDVAVLRGLTADNPAQLHLFSQLSPLIVRKLSQFDESLFHLDVAPGDAGWQSKSTEVGEELMDQIRDNIADMGAEEHRLLYKRQRAAERDARSTQIVMASTTVAGVVVAGFGLLMIQRDIRERSRGQRELQAFAQRLQENNRELQDFVSIASHDLGEPLRKIISFGERMRLKCGPALDQAGLDYLDRMQSAARRMQALIEDLLALSQITTRAEPFQTVDLREIVCDVLTDLEVRIEQTEAQVQVGSLPRIEAEPTQMRQLFQNLLSNSLKFHQPGAAPGIRIMAWDVEHGLGAEGRIRIQVEDNGIGFEPQYAERIFHVFQRLHGRSEYEGTGIGLAICKKIVERHNGSISVTSAPGQGATFTIELPVSHTSS